MEPWTHIDRETADIAPPGVDPETGRPRPSRGAVLLAAGVLLALVAYAGIAFWVNRFYAGVIGFPVVAGALVGALSSRRPLRTAAWIVVVGFVTYGALVFSLGGYAILGLLWFPLLVPGFLIGAACAHTLRRFVRGRPLPER